LVPSVERAACWFLHSGIQEPEGGVARYHLLDAGRNDAGRNAPISSEITGYAASVFSYLFSLTGETQYLDAAKRAARYLIQIWDSRASTLPFEPGSSLAYFFDLGIIVRGLLAASRLTGETEFFDRARDAALSMALDFLGEGRFHAVISLPEKQPLPRERRWSRAPGCYQLKAALAWVELGDESARKLYDCALKLSLAAHEGFLYAERDREKQMDRLHAYCYFLEGLLPAVERDPARGALANGIGVATLLFHKTAPEFERSDVSAQLLRLRIIAHHRGVLELDEQAAQDEVRRIQSFQALAHRPPGAASNESETPRTSPRPASPLCASSPKDDARPQVRGGFYFGKRGSEMLPYVNPVSTAFCMQALEFWDRHTSGRWAFDLRQLI
jgi:hypothetical protein